MRCWGLVLWYKMSVSFFNSSNVFWVFYFELDFGVCEIMGLLLKFVLLSDKGQVKLELDPE